MCKWYFKFFLSSMLSLPPYIYSTPPPISPEATTIPAPPRYRPLWEPLLQTLDLRPGTYHRHLLEIEFGTDCHPHLIDQRIRLPPCNGCILKWTQRYRLLRPSASSTTLPSSFSSLKNGFRVGMRGSQQSFHESSRIRKNGPLCRNGVEPRLKIQKKNPKEFWWNFFFHF